MKAIRFGRIRIAWYTFDRKVYQLVNRKYYSVLDIGKFQIRIIRNSNLGWV